MARDAADASTHAAASTCRNCGAIAPGAFCPQCGQETALALPSARQFLKDAAGRYVALDGRLWRTLAALLFHPGFLTREYLAGRRRRYVRPARLFLVLSLAMFALFRVVVELPSLADGVVLIDASDEADARGATAQQRRAADAVEPLAPSTLPSLTFDRDANLVVAGPPGLVTEALRKRVARFNALPRQDKIEQVTFGFLRYGPYAMIVLLPAFALLLKLLYAGRARRYPQRPRRYAEHLVFAAHDLSFLFLVLIVAVAIPWTPVRVVLTLWVIAYSLLAMKAVYGGRWSGVLLRAWVLGVSYVILLAFVTAGLLVAAVVVR